MKHLFSKATANSEPQGGVFNIYYRIVIGTAAVYSLFSIFIDFRLMEDNFTTSLFINTSIFIFFIAVFTMKKFFTVWIREIVLITTCLLLLISFITSPVKQSFRETGPLIFWVNQILMMISFLTISIGSIIKMYRNIIKARNTSINTGMGNIRWMSLHVNKRINTGISNGILILFSIKNFRIINSLFGRKYGDKLIKIVADLLSPYTDEKLKVAHISGIEFCIWIEDQNEEAIYKGIENLKQEIKIKIHETGKNANVFINTSGAIYPEDGSDFNDLFCRANMAMEGTMANDQLSHCYYDPEIEEDLKTENIYTYEIQKAVENEEFNIFYQAKYDIEGNKIHGIEALARWNSPVLGNVSPSVFIPHIHTSYLTIPFTKMIIRKVMEDIALVDKNFGEDVQVSINIPPSFFHFYGMSDFIQKIIQKEGVDPGRIIFEITEDIFIKGIEDVNAKLAELNRMGIKISLDDFGTGFSSLSYIQDLQIQELKIDKSFIDQIISNEKSFILVKAICDIAKANNFSIVAEGVESEPQVKLLQQTSCDLIQGYIYSKPSALKTSKKIEIATAGI
ncbi:MAG: bifunctional diguanylate cyclase/phosphodiesterase [Spirochaetales bacterium]|nr:bifunctional diguanylate cyclase/phosphodiesterase [Spirochaetales bacterium]